MPKPLSVAIPDITDVSGPYCPRRPNLKEILNNTSPAPWTLAAFMAYLSNNHCLETLEFTMDAGRYRKHYQKMMSRASSNGMPPAKDREYVQALWQRLVDAYIRPNGSREVNLPSDVRDPILDLRPSELPPAPEELDSAVAKIYELMEESVLVPFLNSAYPQTAHPTIQSCPYATSEESLQGVRHDKHSSYSKRGRIQRNSPPLHSAPAYTHYSAPALTNRKSAPSTLTTSLHRARFSSASGSGSGPGMTDDGDSTTDSPTHDSPMTPPTSPPMSDASPKRDSGMWKRLGRLSGMNKVGRKKSQGGLHEEL
ncbi:regulator of G protein signaling superfamily [Teratosphaeria nubilosa]|uniref:Regulator of G protein signaling superfamily n=1 Tax=Teratosphaeria nubilosa TaxID=161662 RepID=A0A6G1LEI4_9PEZI|nr:regulator of G protein signaling superfamily [Teratosphaeria nubilosa]